MSPRRYSRNFLRATGVLGIVLSAGMFYAWASFDGLPPRASLRTATGHVQWVRSDKYGVKFALDGSERAYKYYSKSGAMGAVESNLVHAREPITVLYDPASPSGPIYSDEEFFEVLELSKPAGPIRRYEDVEEGYRSDNRVALWMAPIFLCMGIYTLLSAQRAPR